MNLNLSLDTIFAMHLAFPFQPEKGHLLLQKKEIPETVEKILREGGVDRARATARENAVDIIEYGSSAYPASLCALPDPPLVLYRKGQLPSLSNPSIAIVGTRTASVYGRSSAKEFASICGRRGIPVVSGLARGIDTEAHEGALEYGQTIAVIGSGLAHIYPKENRALSEKICERGALFSEYPLFTPPDRFQFPRRNRLIAALAEGTLLIEAPIKSGALGTMNWAIRLGKLCFALPGRADCETFKGNHHLIKLGKAKLVENGDEMISLLRPGKFIEPRLKDSVVDLSPAESELLHKFPQSEIFFDELALLTQLPVATLTALLMRLRIKNIIREFPGKLFKKVN